MRPTRIQRKRKKGYKQPIGTKYCGRGTKFGNPFIIGDGITRNQAVDLFEQCVEHPHMAYNYFDEIQATLNYEHFKYIKENIGLLREYKYLSCYCPLDVRCHVDPLIKILKETE